MNTLYHMIFLAIERDINLSQLKNWLFEDYTFEAYKESSLFQELIHFDYDQENAMGLFEYFVYKIETETYYKLLINKYLTAIVNNNEVANNLYKLERFKTVSPEINKLTEYRNSILSKRNRFFKYKKRTLIALQSEAAHLLKNLKTDLLQKGISTQTNIT